MYTVSGSLKCEKTSSNRQSFIDLSQLGLEFIPVDENLLLLVDINADSIMICSKICFSNIYCRTFNFNIQSKRCRLYEGDIENTGSIINSQSIQSVVGTIKLTIDDFIDYGRPCSFCENKPYLICMNFTCQCQSHSFFNGSMCQSQKFIEGLCTNDIQCRNDINLTCLSTMQCGFNLTTDDAYANLTSATILATTTHIDSTISISSDTTKTSTISNSDVIGLTSNSTTSISTTTIVNTISTTVSTITTTISSDAINNTTAILTTSITATSSSTSMITSGIGDTVTATSNTDSTTTTTTSTDTTTTMSSSSSSSTTTDTTSSSTISSTTTTETTSSTTTTETASSSTTSSTTTTTTSSTTTTTTSSTTITTTTETTSSSSTTTT
ncbi:unnamed protein product, partial [Adineta steineri]